MAQHFSLGGSYESPRILDWILLSDYFLGVVGVDAKLDCCPLAQFEVGQDYATSTFIQRGRAICFLWHLVLGLLHERAVDAHY